MKMSKVFFIENKINTYNVSEQKIKIDMDLHPSLLGPSSFSIQGLSPSPL